VSSVRFPISFGDAYRVLSSALLLFPASSYVEVEGDQVRVRMGWAFRSQFPRSAVSSAVPVDDRPLSRGVHGFDVADLMRHAGFVDTIFLLHRGREIVKMIANGLRKEPLECHKLPQPNASNRDFLSITGI